MRGHNHLLKFAASALAVNLALAEVPLGFVEEHMSESGLRNLVYVVPDPEVVIEYLQDVARHKFVQVLEKVPLLRNPDFMEFEGGTAVVLGQGVLEGPFDVSSWNREGHHLIIPSGDIGQVTGLRLDSRVFCWTMISQGTLSVEEIYSIDGGPAIRKPYSKWNVEFGLHDASVEYIWERRSDLGGTVLRNAVLEFVPFSVVVEEGGGALRCTGYFCEVSNRLAEILNFNETVMIPPDGKWGAIHRDNGTWSGIVGMLVDGRADISTSGLAVIKSRAEAMDFAASIDTETITALRRRVSGDADGQDTAFNIAAYAEIFRPGAWAALATFAAAAASLLATSVASGVEDIHEDFGFVNALAVFGMTLLQRDYGGVVPSKFPLRAVYLTICLGNVLIFSFYTALLTSLMTHVPPVQEITEFQDVLDLGLQFVVTQDTNSHMTLSMSRKGTVLHKIYYDTMEGREEAFASSTLEMQRMLEGSRAKVGFGTEHAIFGRRDLSALSIKGAPVRNVAFGLRKNSEFNELFSYHIMKMKEQGIVSNIRKKWFGHGGADKDSEKDGGHSGGSTGDRRRSLGYDNLLMPFVLLAAGAVAAVSSLFAELCLSWKVKARVCPL